MSQTPIITKEEAEKLYLALQHNSDVLINTGEDAATKGNYGVAISLSILGVEELIKSVIYYLFGKGVQVFKVKQIKEAMYSHPRKHEFAKLIEVLRIVEKLMPPEKPNIAQHTRNNGSWFQGILKSAWDMIATGIELKQSLTWWESVNSVKNRGFYVDLNKSVISSPADFTKKDYDSNMKRIEDFSKRFNRLKALLDTASSTDQTIIDMNSAIELYITNGTKHNN
jgi:AbiV family abortive infection protein